MAKFFVTERTPLSGGNSKHTRSDTLSDTFFIETKYRKRSPLFTLFAEVKKLAAKEGKLPMLALCQKGSEGFLLATDKDTFLKAVEAYRKLKGA